VRAVFGEKYPDPVRVVSVGTADPVHSITESTAVEFCGGTHLDRTGKIGLFKIVSEESVARGVRRITAVTGHEAVRHVEKFDEVVRLAVSALRVPPEKIVERIEAMQAEIKKLRKQPVASGGAGAEQVVETPAGKAVIINMPTADPAAMRNTCDQQRQKGAVAVLVGGTDGEKVTLVAMVTDELAKQVKAGDWVKAVAAIVGGSGGGKPTLAQAGGKDPSKLPEALEAGKAWIAEKLM
jgi:alanyl-tRNA synthetase